MEIPKVMFHLTEKKETENETLDFPVTRWLLSTRKIIYFISVADLFLGLEFCHRAVSSKIRLKHNGSIVFSKKVVPTSKPK